ncbi:MAG: hypothetical protein CMJ32_10265 [Phycisphaerae bacterium]|nr:hypothetical protein [Phycisphaerae bacterium]
MTTLSNTPDKLQSSSASRTRCYGMMAEFATPGEIMKAAEKVRAAGYRWWDCHTPFPVHGLDNAMGISPTILPVFVFFAGLTGTMIAFGLQAFTNATDWSIWAFVWVTGYPFLISGKPLLSVPAFIPVMFELTILLSALTTFGLMFLLNGLPRLHHPLFTSNRFLRASDDRFFIVIEARDPRFRRQATRDFLEGLSPIAVEEVLDT